MSVKIGLVGTGTVGGGCIDILHAHHDDFVARYGVDLELVRVCSLIPEQAEAHGVSHIFTLDYHDIVNDPQIEVVIELIGGTGVAKSIVCEALRAGKHVVTANKALIASCGDEIMKLAASKGREVLFEASVGGGIPIIEPLKRSLAANDVHTVMGIVNGTTNYMLTRMADEGLPYDEVLAQAQANGFAEADPTADVDGHDAAAKIAILSSIAFHRLVTIADVHTEGIRAVTPADLAAARSMGRAIKLVATGRSTPAGVEAHVHPVMLPLAHPLATVDGVMNAIYAVGDAVGETMFYGAGAGSGPAASAVMGDVVEVARRIELGWRPDATPLWTDPAAIVPFDDLRGGYYARLSVTGNHGSLARVAQAFAARGVALASIEQADAETIVLVAADAREADVQAALADIAAEQGFLACAPSVIRMEG